MRQKVIRIGSSQGVTLSSDLLRSAGLKLGDTVSVSINQNNGLIEIQPSEHERNQELLAEALKLTASLRDELEKMDDVAVN